jgi:hypothetical protein
MRESQQDHSYEEIQGDVKVSGHGSGAIHALINPVQRGGQCGSSDSSGV